MEQTTLQEEKRDYAVLVGLRSPVLGDDSADEESLAELEQKNGKVLRFTVSNAPVAAQLLQQEMGVRDVAVENEQDLTVRDLRLDTGAAVRRFVEAGLVVSDAHLYEDTLEDYFKRITGGEGIA